jgi:serine/threonine protein kinase
VVFTQVATGANLPFLPLGNLDVVLENGDLWSPDCTPLSKGGYGSVFKVKLGVLDGALKLFHFRGKTTFANATMELVMVTTAKARSTIVASARAVGVVKKDGNFLPFIVYEYIQGKRVCDIIHYFNTEQYPSQASARWNFCCDLVVAFVLKFQNVSPVVHADIKGDNIIASWHPVKRCYMFCFLDFGLAGITGAPLDQKRLNDKGKTMWWVGLQGRSTFSPAMDTFSVAILLVQILNPSWSSLFNKERRFSLEYVKEACAGIAFQETRKTLSECLRVPDSRKLLQHFV